MIKAITSNNFANILIEILIENKVFLIVFENNKINIKKINLLYLRL